MQTSPFCRLSHPGVAFLPCIRRFAGRSGKDPGEWPGCGGNHTLTDAAPHRTLGNMGTRPRIKNYEFRFNFFITPGVQALLIANFAVFFFQVLYRQYAGVLAHQKFLFWFGLVPAGVIPGLRFWQPFTYLFLHDPSTIWHILTNMFVLWMFGRELELVWGKNRFLKYYFITGVGAGIINILVKTVPALFGRGFSYVPTIGASGAIFGVLIACAILFPDRQVMLLPIPIRLRMRTIVTVMVVLDVSRYVWIRRRQG